MALFVWNWDLDPAFPMAVLEYETTPQRDPLHWHDYLEVAAVLDGHGSFLVGPHALPAEPGDVFFIDNSLPHVARPEDGTRPLHLLLLLFRPELIAGPLSRPFDQGFLDPFRAEVDPSARRVAADCELAAVLRPLLAELHQTWRTSAADDRQLLDADLRRILALANRARGRSGRGPSDEAATDRRERIRPVLAYVDEHRAENVTLDDVARVINVSPSRVRHMFRELTGIGFKDWVTQVRMTEARKLLLGTDLPVAEVAHRVSYTNLHQFYRAFGRASSMTPAAYRHYFTSPATDSGANGSTGEKRAAA